MAIAKKQRGLFLRPSNGNAKVPIDVRVQAQGCACKVGEDRGDIVLGNRAARNLVAGNRSFAIGQELQCSHAIPSDCRKQAVCVGSCGSDTFRHTQAKRLEIG